MRPERKKTKKRNKGKGRRTVKNENRLRGGKPKFIKTIAYYTDGPNPMLVDYKIIHHNMDKEQQKKYADKHKVYYPVETPSIFDEIFGSVDPVKVKLMTERFFTPPLMFFEGNKVQAYREKKWVPCEIRRNLGNDMYDVLYDTGDFGLVHKDMIRPLGKQRTAIKEDGETIVIHDGEDIEKIKITNKMLMNHYVSNKLMENLEKIPASVKKGGAPLNQDEITRYTASVEKYNNFINENKDTLLNGLSVAEREVAENLLRTPVFFNIISEARGFGEIPDMNHAKIIMENDELSGDELLKKINEHSSVPGPIISVPISKPVAIKSASGPIISGPISKPVAIKSESGLKESGLKESDLKESGFKESDLKESDPEKPLIDENTVHNINLDLSDQNISIDNFGNIKQIVDGSTTVVSYLDDGTKTKVNDVLMKHGYKINNKTKVEKIGLARRTLSAIGTGAKNIGTGIGTGAKNIGKGIRQETTTFVNNLKKIGNLKTKNKVGIFPTDPPPSGSPPSGSPPSGPPPSGPPPSGSPPSGSSPPGPPPSGSDKAIKKENAKKAISKIDLNETLGAQTKMLNMISNYSGLNSDASNRNSGGHKRRKTLKRK